MKVIEDGKCTSCGGQLEKKGKQYVCAYCGKVYEEKEVRDSSSTNFVYHYKKATPRQENAKNNHRSSSSSWIVFIIFIIIFIFIALSFLIPLFFF